MFWRQVSQVLTGSIITQLVPILGSLLLTRIYAPSEFGVFSAWLGLSIMLAVPLTGRFETALAIIADGEPRRKAVLATLFTTVISSLLIGAIVLISILILGNWTVAYPITLVVLIIPTALFIASTAIWQSWSAADGHYSQLNKMRIAQAVPITALQIAIGYFHPSATALALAHFIGVISGFGASILLKRPGHISLLEIQSSIIDFWSEHKNFPFFSLPADFINSASTQLPLLIVAARFGADVAGYLALTLRVLGAPIGILGKSVLDVFKRYAASSFLERGECKEEYLRTFRVLAIGSLIFSLVMYFIAERVFVFAFGNEWIMAGTYAIWLLPLFAMRFMASPLSYMVYIAGKQHVDLIWQIGLILMTIVTLYMFEEHSFSLISYSIGYSAMYMIYLILSYSFSKGR